MKYRAKPRKVRAYQVTGEETPQQTGLWPRWLERRYLEGANRPSGVIGHAAPATVYFNATFAFAIRTKEGVVTPKPNDFVVLEDEELTVWSPDDFLEIFEPVTD